MGKNVILLGEVAERGATTIDIKCGRCERHGRLSMARLLREYGPHIMSRGGANRGARDSRLKRTPQLSEMGSAPSLPERRPRRPAARCGSAGTTLQRCDPDHTLRVVKIIVSL
jgi:hypothetical protein